MTYQEFIDKANEILAAIKSGNYQEDFESPNFVEEHEHNGRVVLVVGDNEGPTSSNDCGSASYTVCGEEFTVERDFYGENEKSKVHSSMRPRPLKARPRITTRIMT